MITGFPDYCEGRHILGQEEEVLAQLKQVMAAHFCCAQWALLALPPLKQSVHHRGLVKPPLLETPLKPPQWSLVQIWVPPSC